MPTNRFIAQSRVMRALVDQVRRFARTDSNVLIAGETGTGKNAVAQELHARSPRAAAPYGSCSGAWASRPTACSVPARSGR